MAFRHLALEGEPSGKPESAKAAKQAAKVRKALEDDRTAFAHFTKAATVVWNVLIDQLGRDQLRSEGPVALLRKALNSAKRLAGPTGSRRLTLRLGSGRELGRVGYLFGREAKLVTVNRA